MLVPAVAAACPSTTVCLLVRIVVPKLTTTVATAAISRGGG